MLKYMNKEMANKLIETDSSYSNIICKCEHITEGEIKDAISRFPHATTRDGVKRRVRAGMGPCQGNRCGSNVDIFLSEKR